MKKLPKIDQFNLSKVNNNKKVFDSSKDKDIEIKEEKKESKNNKNISVKDKIKNLIKENNYIFNKEVTLIYNDSSEKCNIAGIVNNHIITMDNKIIKIDDLKDIKY